MWKFNWLSVLCTVHIHIHFILNEKRFLPAYAQPGMLGNMFAKVPVVAITATVTEQTKCYTSSSLKMVDPEII